MNQSPPFFSIGSTLDSNSKQQGSCYEGIESKGFPMQVSIAC